MKQAGMLHGLIQNGSGGRSRPGNDPGFAAFLVETGIDSISLVPDSVLKVIHAVAEAENR